MTKIEITIHIVEVILFVFAYTYILKNKKSIKRRYSFHYNSQAKERIKKIKDNQVGLLNRIEHLEVRLMNFSKVIASIDSFELEEPKTPFIIEEMKSKIPNQLKTGKKGLFTKGEIEKEITRLHKDNIMNIDYHKEYRLAYNRLYKNKIRIKK